MRPVKSSLLLCGFAILLMSCNSTQTASITPIVLSTALGTTIHVVIETETPAVSFTPTPEPTGTQTPTPILTLDYAKLASHYLTPFPALTPRTDIPAQTPTPKPVNPLLEVFARKLSNNWTPTPPPPVAFYGDTIIPQAKPGWRPSYIQAVTDLMNFISADQKLYSQYVDSWAPKGRYIFGATWLLKNDFDHDGQPEWLASIPVYYQNPEIACCSQLIILFEKKENVYQPVYYEERSEDNNTIEKVLFVGDLNEDGYAEIVFQSMSCGSACSQYLHIGRWDGKNWTDYFINTTAVTDRIAFIDYNNDGKIEIILDYKTDYAKGDALYPIRQATDIYGWKNGKLVILEELRQPSTNHYAIMRDVYSALSFGNTSAALKSAQPIMESLGQTCSQMETYTGVEVMLAYAIQNKPASMQLALSQIIAHCNQPDNGFTYAAEILWQAYRQVHDPVLACEAMDRFVADFDERSRRPRSDINSTRYQFFDGTVWLPNGLCPIQPEPGR